MKIFKVVKRVGFTIFPFLKPKLYYIALGDSTVEGVGASHSKRSYAGQLAKFLAEDFQVKLINLGRRGATSADVLAEQVLKVLQNKVKPQLLTLSVGPNDIRKLKSLGEFRKNLELTLKFLSNSGAIIVINTIPDMSRLPQLPKLTRLVVKFRVKQFNRVIRDLAKNYHVHVCDLYEESQRFGQVENYLSEDGFHLSDLGYNLWAKLLYADLKPLLVK